MDVSILDQFLTLPWVTIAAATFGKFFLSVLLNVFGPHHKGQFRALQDEKALVDLIKKQKLQQPGVYRFPAPVKQGVTVLGPRGYLRLRSPHESLGKCLVQSLLVDFILSIAIVLVLMRAQVGSAKAVEVTGLVSFGFFAGGLMYPFVWSAHTYHEFFGELLDSFLYAVLMAATIHAVPIA